MLDENLRLGGVAHDFKGLLTRAWMAIDQLEMHSDAPVRRQAQRANSALEQIQALCLREFDAAKGSDGEQFFNAQDLKAFLRKTFSLATPKHHAEHCLLSHRISVEQGVSLTIDAPILFRVLFNLISNATTAMAKHGGGELFLDAKDCGSSVLFNILDKGPGLPDHVLAYLFPCAEAGPRQRGRIGEGLITAVSLSKELGGEILLVDTGAQGTAFQLSVPTRPSQSSHQTLPSTGRENSKFRFMPATCNAP